MQGTSSNSILHPQTDSYTEALNKTIVSYLHCFYSTQPKLWSKRLCWQSIGIIPLFSELSENILLKLYMVKLSTLINILTSEICVESVAISMTYQQKGFQQLKFHLTKAQQKLQYYANKHRQDVTFLAGESFS